MKHQLPPLPYPKDALMPHVSAETLDYHHDKHHRAYVDKLNKLVAGTPHAEQDLEEIVRTSTGEIFNNASQAWNHAFFWQCLTPRGGGEPNGRASELIKGKWGSFERFKQEFTEAATGHFGSGWAWLALDPAGTPQVLATHDAMSPLANGGRPLLTLDLWEHAYYIDHRNERARHVEAFWRLANWDFVGKRL